MKSDISQAIARPSSYLETENLEIQERVINLGKRLLNSFQNNDSDEITFWMINYLAEQIDVAETTSSQEAKQKCFETIIKLWESRSSFPNGSRPFESLEPVFLVLDSLSPENSIPRYISNSFFEEFLADENAELVKWLEGIKVLDETARILISFLLEHSMKLADTDEVKGWIKSVVGTVESDEVKFLLRVYRERNGSQQENINELKKRIDKLEKFEKFSVSVRSALMERLNMFEDEN